MDIITVFLLLIIAVLGIAFVMQSRVCKKLELTINTLNKLLQGLNEEMKMNEILKQWKNADPE